MDYLLSTWEVRAQLPSHLLIEMRTMIGTRIVADEPSRVQSVSSSPLPSPYRQHSNLIAIGPTIMTVLVASHMVVVEA
jgi:hypothetical protein